MGSNVKTSDFKARLMPYVAILQHDLGTMWRSRLVRFWFVGSVLLTIVLFLSNWTRFQDAPMISLVLFPYLVFPWFLVVLALGVSPVSGAQAETLADSILSRPVSRLEYLLATWSSRVALVWLSYLVVIIPAIALIMFAKRPTAEDTVTFYGIISSLFMVGLVLTFLVSIGYLMGTLLRKPLFAVILLIFIWYPINLVLHAFSIEQFSPISLNQALTTQLRQPWRPDPDAPENRTDNEEAKALSAQLNRFFRNFSSPETSKPEFFEREEYEDITVRSVCLGYGLPTLLCLAIAAMVFQRRDL